MSKIRDGEETWQWSRVEIRLNTFRRSTVSQKQSIVFTHFPPPLKIQKVQVPPFWHLKIFRLPLQKRRGEGRYERKCNCYTLGNVHMWGSLVSGVTEGCAGCDRTALEKKLPFLKEYESQRKLYVDMNATPVLDQFSKSLLQIIL